MGDHKDAVVSKPLTKILFNLTSGFGSPLLSVVLNFPESASVVFSCNPEASNGGRPSSVSALRTARQYPARLRFEVIIIANTVFYGTYSPYLLFSVLLA